MEPLIFITTDPDSGSKLKCTFASPEDFLAAVEETPADKRTFTEFLASDRSRKLYLRYHLATGQENPVAGVSYAIVETIDKKWSKSLSTADIIYTSYRLATETIVDVIVPMYFVTCWREANYFATQVQELIPSLQLDNSVYKPRAEILYPGCFIPLVPSPDGVAGKQADADKVVKTNCILSYVADSTALGELAISSGFVANPSAGEMAPQEIVTVMPKLEISPSTRKIVPPIVEPFEVAPAGAAEKPACSLKGKRSFWEKIKFFFIGNSRRSEARAKYLAKHNLTVADLTPAEAALAEHATDVEDFDSADSTEYTDAVKEAKKSKITLIKQIILGNSRRPSDKPGCGCNKKPTGEDKPGCGCNKKPTGEDKPGCGCRRESFECSRRKSFDDCDCKHRPHGEEKPACCGV